MENPYKAGDSVLIQRKGTELEATVRTTWNHEVQVRAIVDGELLWRTVKTVKSLDTSDTPAIPGTVESAAILPMADPKVGQTESEPIVLPDGPDAVEVTPATEEPVATASDSLNSDQPAKRTRKPKKRGKGTPRKSGLDDNFDQ